MTVCLSLNESSLHFIMCAHILIIGCGIALSEHGKEQPRRGPQTGTEWTRFETNACAGHCQGEN